MQSASATPESAASPESASAASASATGAAAAAPIADGLQSPPTARNTPMAPVDLSVHQGSEPAGTPQQQSQPQQLGHQQVLSSSRHCPPIQSASPRPDAPSPAPHRPSVSPSNSQRPSISSSEPNTVPPSLPPVPGPGVGLAPASSDGPMNASDNANPSADFRAQLNSFKTLISKHDPKVVRQAIRDYWQTCLAGSDFHTSFVTDAVIRHAPPEVIAKALRTHGAKSVQLAKHDVIEFLTAEDLDELADNILSKASNQFMDKVLARRLETIHGQDLVNALARAERLGYDLRDVAEGRGPGSASEHVIPSSYPAARHSANAQSPAPPPPSAGNPFSHPASVKSKWVNRQQTSSPLPPTAILGPHGPPPSLPMPQTITRSTPNIVYCASCHRPCSSYEALLHHSRKAGCQGNVNYRYLSRDSCLHCGCHFAGPAGKLYHTKSNVCGRYPPEMDKIMSDLLASYHYAAPPISRVATPQRVIPVVPAVPGNHYQTPRSKPASAGPGLQQTPAPTGTPSAVYSSGPYAHMTPQERSEFEAEMKAIEVFYGDLMKKAMELSDKEQELELTKIKNRFNTKQSTTRKKFGIRLRERRTQAEIEAERRHLLGMAEQSPEGQAAKRARMNGGGQFAVTQSIPVPIHESPRKRVPLTEMGGLSGSQATAELVDPTASLTPAVMRSAPYPSSAPGPHRGTSDDPMQVDDDSETDSDTESDESDESDEDIPARVAPSAQSAAIGVPS